MLSEMLVSPCRLSVVAAVDCVRIRQTRASARAESIRAATAAGGGGEGEGGMLLGVRWV